MSKSKQQFEHYRKQSKEIKKLYSIKKALSIIEYDITAPAEYYITDDKTFYKRIRQTEFINLTK